MMETANKDVAEDPGRALAEGAAEASIEAAATGNPALIGVPTFLVGSIALGLVLVGYVPATGASIPIIMTATGIGQVIAAVWAARLDQNAVASVFGIFSGFWISYAALVLGLTHNWFGIVTPADALGSQKPFLAAADRPAHPVLAAAAAGVHGALRAHRAGPAAGVPRHVTGQYRPAARRRLGRVRLRHRRRVPVRRRDEFRHRREPAAAGTGRPALTGPAAGRWWWRRDCPPSPADR
jgi:hypothetical protein